MKQIKVGTCVPGDRAAEWLPHIAKAGFECVSVNFHMSLQGIDLEELAKKVREILDGTGVYVSTLGFYCNPLMYEEHKKILERCIDTAHLFGAKNVATFAGAYEGQPAEKAVPQFGKVFGELCRRAESEDVRIVIENCPMGGTWEHCTCNIGFNPKAWEMMFNEVPSDALGLEWEPAHQYRQMIDPIAQLRKWAPKIYHLHGKDSTVDLDAVRQFGVLQAVEFAEDRLPGFGDTNWRDVFFVLFRNGYDGDICIEGYHDPIYRRDWEMTGQLHALNYLKWCRGGDFKPNPWD